MTVNADGSYLLDLSGKADIQPGDQAQIWYVAPDGNRPGVDLYAPYLQANVQVSHNWINGNAMPSVTVTVVVSDSGGAYKGGGEN